MNKFVGRRHARRKIIRCQDPEFNAYFIEYLFHTWVVMEISVRIGLIIPITRFATHRKIDVMRILVQVDPTRN